MRSAIPRSCWAIKLIGAVGLVGGCPGATGHTTPMANQTAAVKVFGLLGFAQLLMLPDYVKDMQAVSHDYILMGVDLPTAEEYAGQL